MMNRLVGAMLAAYLCSASTTVIAGDFIFTNKFELGLGNAEPADLSTVLEIKPMGHTDGVRHVLPANTLAVEFSNQDQSGSQSVQVRAVGTAELALVQRRWVADQGRYYYQVFLQHSDRYTSHVSGLTSLSSAVSGALQGSWFDLSATQSAVALGQSGQPSRVILLAGTPLGNAQNFLASWSFGLIDSDSLTEPLGSGLFRFPSFEAVAANLGVPVTGSLISGNPTLNATCPLDALSSATRQQWESKLSVAHCGTGNFDMASTAQGNWFNPEVDALSPHPIDLQPATMSIVPDAETAGRYRVAFGRGSDLAQFDPNGQFAQSGTAMTFDAQESPARVNVAPSSIAPDSGIHCFDLFADVNDGFYNRLYVRLDDDLTLAAEWDSTQRATPSCEVATNNFGEPLTARFVR